MEGDMWWSHATAFRVRVALEALKVEMIVRKKLRLSRLSGSHATKIESSGDLRGVGM